jgi:hypothetical protein
LHNESEIPLNEAIERYKAEATVSPAGEGRILKKANARYKAEATHSVSPLHI